MIDTPGKLDRDWLSEVLGAEVATVSLRRVGTGQVGTCYRLELTGEPGVPASLIAKLPTADPEARAWLTLAYRTEVHFYQDIAPTVAIRVPRCHYSAVSDDATVFTLLLEDAAPAEQGDQLAGCAPAQAEAAARNLAGLHGPRWCDPDLIGLSWLMRTGQMEGAFSPAVEAFVGRFADRLAAEDRETLEEAAGVIDRWALARPERFGLVHGDYRLDNLMFSPGGTQVTAVDWQTLCLGHPLRDVAYLLGTGMDPDQRAACEKDVVAAYHEELTWHGVRGYSVEECFEDYRYGALQGPFITVLGWAAGRSTERGDAMFLAMTRRSCAMIRDLRSFELF